MLIGRRGAVRDGGRPPGGGRGPLSAGGRALRDRSPWRTTLLPLFLLLLVLVPSTGCGLSSDDSTDVVAVPTDAASSGEEGAATARRGITVWFVLDDRLTAVPRSATAAGPRRAVEQLLAGPTRSEVDAGIRTALSRQDLMVISDPDGTRVVTVSVGREFAGLGGSSQLLAVAQLVWTTTQFPSVDRVRFVLDGGPLEVPTDAGLVVGPVSRADYDSVAPRRAMGTGTTASGGASRSGGDAMSSTTARRTD